MKPQAFIGVDPGITGAIAFYVPESGLLVVSDMPTLLQDGKLRLNRKLLGDMLLEWANSYPMTVATVEKVHAMPKQGVVSSFNFGYVTGAMHQALASAGIPIHLISPQVWKVAMGLAGGAENKDRSRAKASKIFPKHSAYWARKKDHGRAEAALLAHYGSKLNYAV